METTSTTVDNPRKPNAKLFENDRYIFTRNDPYDRSAPIELVIPQHLQSKAYMESIRSLGVPHNAIAVWYLGQNGFILKDDSGVLIAIDLYLSNSCASVFSSLPFRLDRQLPVFIEPEDLDVDFFIATHSHVDHCDPETVRRMPKTGKTIFIGPYDSIRVFRACGVQDLLCWLIHPGQKLKLTESVLVEATFALPTDNTELNHIGVLLNFGNEIKFYDTGDTAYAERLGELLPKDVDICAICMNGGFHNLGTVQAAAIIRDIQPRTVIPCHYDMMINNVGCPDMLRVALDQAGSKVEFSLMRYYEPFFYFARSAAEH